LSVTSIVGAFTQDEVIQGQTSGATGYLIDDVSNSAQHELGDMARELRKALIASLDRQMPTFLATLAGAQLSFPTQAFQICNEGAYVFR